MHILFITFFSLFVFHLQVGVGPLLLNASLLLVLTTDYSDWLVQVTELIDNWQWWNLLSFDVKRLKEAYLDSKPKYTGGVVLQPESDEFI